MPNGGTVGERVKSSGSRAYGGKNFEPIERSRTHFLDYSSRRDGVGERRIRWGEEIVIGEDKLDNAIKGEFEEFLELVDQSPRQQSPVNCR